MVKKQTDRTMALDPHNDIRKGLCKREYDEFIRHLLGQHRNGVGNDELIDDGRIEALGCRGTGDELAARIRFARRSLRAFGPSQSKPAVSTISSMRRAVLPSTSPMRFMTSAHPGHGRRFSMMAIGA